MNRQIFEEMVQEVSEFGEVSIVVDAISSHGSYSAGQSYFQAKRCFISPRNNYVMIENIKTSFAVTTTKFSCLAIPYERIVAVGVVSQ